MTKPPTPGNGHDVRPTQTPWGPAQSVQLVRTVKSSCGVWSVSTASHGGIWVHPTLHPLLPKGWRRAYFEEDCDWCIPLLAFGISEGETRLQKAAEDTLRYWHPDLVDTLLPSPALNQKYSAS